MDLVESAERGSRSSWIPQLTVVAINDLSPLENLAFFCVTIRLMDVTKIVKVLSCYDNEWEFAAQMVNEATRLVKSL